jgi:hypothetical protein
VDDGKLPPPFVVGQKYFDREGEYTVTAADADHVAIERPDGRQMIAEVALKARIHRNVVQERDANPGSGRAYRSGKRREPGSRRNELMEKILQLEADGADHTGVEIDRLLASVARDVGYSEEDVSTLHSETGRSMFANEGDWAKAKMTEWRLHEVVGSTVHWESGVRRQCNVYRITAGGLDELRRRS